MRRVWSVAVCLFSYGLAFAQAQDAPTIVEIRIEQEGRVIDDRLSTGLIETMPGAPLSMREVRETLAHLTSLSRFEDVQVLQEPVAGGVRLRYVLVPLHPVDRMEFRGERGLPEGEIRRVVAERFGATPSAGRAQEVAEAIRTLYRDRGYPAARVTPRVEETHNPDRATLAFDVTAGLRSAIGRVEIDEIDGSDRRVPPGGIAVRAGDPYDNEAILRELERYAGEWRARGFYEARVVHTTTFGPDGHAAVRITVDRGPLVSVTFAGDPLSEADRDRLVPVRAEGSVDEDLLEDANFAIEEYLHARGYRDATASYERLDREGELTVAFTVTRGSRYVVGGVTLAGNLALPATDLRQLLGIEPGQPFVQASASAGAVAIRDAYRRRGFTRAAAQTAFAERPPDAGGGDRRIDVRVTIAEGPRTLVESIAFEGNSVLTDGQLRALMVTALNRPYSEIDVGTDRDRIDLEYRNRGYDSVVVDPAVSVADNGTQADVRFAISEGPQIIVAHVIILGNERTRTETIERELLLRPGLPLGYSARLESQQRLAALGLFRRVTIEELRYGGGAGGQGLVRGE